MTFTPSRGVVLVTTGGGSAPPLQLEPVFDSLLSRFLSVLLKGCGDLVSVGEPVTHKKADNIEGKYGVWMQDPEPVTPYGAAMIWRIDTVGSDIRKLFGYDDMVQFTKGFPSKVR